MSKDEKESRLLEERIAKIRQKNEEIKKRHLEVEADKLEAEKANAMVQMLKDSTYVTISQIVPSKPSDDNENENNSTITSGRVSSIKKVEHPTKSIAGRGSNRPKRNNANAKCYLFGEGDGPPPDPVFNFLADRERDPVVNYPLQGRGNLPASRSRQETSRKFRGAKTQIQSSTNHPAYQAWKSERYLIDQDRINRQKTAEGQWKREWDQEKKEEDWKFERNYSRKSQEMPPQDVLNIGIPSEQTIAGGKIRSRRIVQCLPVNVTALKCDATSPERSVKAAGSTLQVKVPNATNGKRQILQKKWLTPEGGSRTQLRSKSQLSCSSQSEEEHFTVTAKSKRQANYVHHGTSLRPPIPPFKDTTYKGYRSRLKVSDKRKDIRKRRISSSSPSLSESETNSKENQQYSSSEKFIKSTKTKATKSATEDSWEDVTTSGTESLCDDGTETDNTSSNRIITQESIDNSDEKFTSISAAQNEIINEPLLLEENDKILHDTNRKITKDGISVKVILAPDQNSEKDLNAVINEITENTDNAVETLHTSSVTVLTTE